MKSINKLLICGVVILNILATKAGIGPVPSLNWQVLNPRSDLICCGTFALIHGTANKAVTQQNYTQLQLNIDSIIKGNVATNSVLILLPNQLMDTAEYIEDHNRYLLFLKQGAEGHDLRVTSDWILKLCPPHNIPKEQLVSSELMEQEVLAVIEQSKAADENTRLAWSLIRSVQPHSALITNAMVRLSNHDLSFCSVRALGYRLLCGDYEALNLIDKYVKNDKSQLLDGLYVDLMNINKSSAIPYLSKCFGIKRPYLERGAMEALSNCDFDKHNKDIKEMILCGLRSEDILAQYKAIKTIRQGWQQELHDQIKDKTMSKLPSISKFKQSRAEYIQAWREVLLNN